MRNSHRLLFYEWVSGFTFQITQQKKMHSIKKGWIRNIREQKNIPKFAIGFVLKLLWPLLPIVTGDDDFAPWILLFWAKFHPFNDEIIGAIRFQIKWFINSAIECDRSERIDFLSDGSLQQQYTMRQEKYVNTNMSVSKLEETKAAWVDKVVKCYMNGYKLWLVCVCVCEMNGEI